MWRAVLLALLGESFLISRIYSLKLFGLLALLLPIHVGLAIIWKVLLWPFLFSPLRNLPEPKGASWIHGHRHLMPDSRSGHPQDEWINEISNDGLIRYRSKFNSEFLMLTSSKALSEVLVQKSYDFAKPRSLRLGLGRILGVGLIVAEGNEHKLQRRRLQPAFAHRHIKNLHPIFWAKALELQQRLLKTVKTDAVRENGASAKVCLPNWIARTTLDIIGQAGMGQDFHAIQDPDNEVCNAYASVFDRPTSKSKLALLTLVLEEIVARVIPISRTDNIAVASERLKRVGRNLIAEKQRIRSEKGSSESKDIISVALDSEVFSDENLVNQILTFLAAGHETTATTISWAVVALTRYPDVQAKLRKEVQPLLGKIKDLAAATASLDVLEDFPYLHAVCNEVLRLYPPAGLTKRTTVKDTTILGQFVPKGTSIIICMRAINHSIAHWGPDATVFNPDRWLGAGNWNSGGAVDNFSYMTFLHGPRSCIGQSFAKAEFAILLAVLVATFKIELDEESQSIESETGLTTRPKRLEVRLTPLYTGG